MRTLRAQHSLDGALRILAESSYGHRVRGDMAAAAARRAVAATALWHLRVLAGWLPSGGAALVGAVAGWFELENIEGRALDLATGGAWPEAPHELGVLASVWPRVAAATTLEQVRAALANSSWGDPGAASVPALMLGVHLGWARRLRDVLREAHEWSDGAMALAIAKARFSQGTVPTELSWLPRVAELGALWPDAEDLNRFAAAVPPSARWTLVPVHEPADLWKAERIWWTRVDRDAVQLLRHARLGRTTALAAAALLVTDSWRTQAALGQAARGLTSSDRGEA